MNIDNIPMVWVVACIAVVIWDMTLRGFALWRAGQRGDLVWFIVLLVVNSVGVLPIIYLFTHHSLVKK